MYLSQDERRTDEILRYTGRAYRRTRILQSVANESQWFFSGFHRYFAVFFGFYSNKVQIRPKNTTFRANAAAPAAAEIAGERPDLGNQNTLRGVFLNIVSFLLTTDQVRPTI